MFVYILKSLKDGSHYVGMTDEINRRLKQHKLGRNYSSRKKRPWVIIHVEIVETRSNARKLEKYFKRGYGREIILEIDSTLQLNIPL